MEFTFLGTGNAANIPAYGCQCQACSRARQDEHFRRRSCSAMVQTGQVRFALDAGLTDFGERFPHGSLDAIVLTHYHMDHVQGLFPIRWGRGEKLPVIGPNDLQGCDDLYKHPGILDFSKKACAFGTFELGDVRLTPVPLNHSKMTLGYIIEHAGKSLAYLTDTAGLPEDTCRFMKNIKLDALVLDCSFPPREGPPKGHNDINLALKISEMLQPATTWMTHIGHDLEVWLMEHGGDLPGQVLIARDNQVLEI